tara:strand:+ start:2976 stop:3494 length:519 start_codon:yes stop_codon:yes gene_type:complete
MRTRYEANFVGGGRYPEIPDVVSVSARRPDQISETDVILSKRFENRLDESTFQQKLHNENLRMENDILKAKKRSAIIEGGKGVLTAIATIVPVALLLKTRQNLGSFAESTTGAMASAARGIENVIDCVRGEEIYERDNNGKKTTNEASCTSSLLSFALPFVILFVMYIYLIK